MSENIWLDDGSTYELQLMLVMQWPGMCNDLIYVYTSYVGQVINSTS